jgi:hypothetical protein
VSQFPPTNPFSGLWQCEHCEPDCLVLLLEAAEKVEADEADAALRPWTRDKKEP